MLFVVVVLCLLFVVVCCFFFGDRCSLLVVVVRARGCSLLHCFCRRGLLYVVVDLRFLSFFSSMVSFLFCWSSVVT